jgi:hypothetical protein
MQNDATIEIRLPKTMLDALRLLGERGDTKASTIARNIIGTRLRELGLIPPVSPAEVAHGVTRATLRQRATSRKAK